MIRHISPVYLLKDPRNTSEHSLTVAAAICQEVLSTAAVGTPWFNTK